MSKNWIGNRRASWHDYTSRWIYLITLLKNPFASPFGSLYGDHNIPLGQPGSPYIQASKLGKVVKNCLREISSIHPALKIYQYSLMPDHLHIVLSVEQPLDEPLGNKLAAFKVMVNNRAKIDKVFETGFNDQILTTTRNLTTIFDYLRENPYRLAMQMAYPDFFRRTAEIRIGGNRCSAYGNMQLLSNPFKSQVIVHRADSNAEFARKKAKWLHIAANSGVLVSPFISKREKEVRTEAEALGGRFIIIGNEPLNDREKPTKRNFTLCSEGRLLFVSPIEPMEFSRIACRRMNLFAQLICSDQPR